MVVADILDATKKLKIDTRIQVKTLEGAIIDIAAFDVSNKDSEEPSLILHLADLSSIS